MRYEYRDREEREDVSCQPTAMVEKVGCGRLRVVCVGSRSNVGEKEMVGYSHDPCRHRTSRFWNPGWNAGTSYSITQVGNSFRIYKRNSIT